ncbi:hypothetical protein WR25_10410 [Diploscapter pachys]|uniref:Uncharacterized protein n=1 Tax=Diploscapter pachys TaxID=2018661 RepID=A0A2A2JLP4_9BILA|nr:hypothetical protein WR25_10410 [Diploscapter pachys]
MSIISSAPFRCARGNPIQVQKRYPEILKLATFSEVDSILARSGIQAEAKTILVGAKKFSGCVMKCVERGSAGKCTTKLGCGLDLPSDRQVVQTTKQCAIRSGFNTAGVQSLCHCIAGSGVRGLDSLCNRIIIS